MQPNEPNPDKPSTLPVPDSTVPSPSSPQPQSLYTNTPDYLGLQPIAEPQPPKSRKKPLFIIIATLLLIGAVAGALFYWQWMQGASERRFYTALDKLMQTSYVTREYDVTNKTTDTKALTKVSSDFSNPAEAKSDIAYTVSYDTTKSSIKGENIVLSSNEFLTRYENATPDTIPKGTVANQWYRVAESATQNTTVNYDLRDFGTRVTFNSPLGLVLTGQFNSQVRTELMSFIKNNAVYRIANTQSEKINNKQSTVYEVQLDVDLLNKLNEQAKKATGLTQSLVMTKSQQSNAVLKFVIDDTSESLSSVLYTIGESTPTFQKNIAFTYSSKITVSSPANIKDLPK